MMRPFWKASINWSFKFSGNAELVPGAPNGGGGHRRTVGRWLANIVRSVFVVVVGVPGAVELGGEWSSPLELLTQSLGLKTERIVATQLGEQHAVALPEGPRLVLNTATTIHTQESMQLKEIHLKTGEVLVDSTAKASKPVLVAAGAVAAQANHAKFSVLRAKDGTCTLRVFGGEVVVFPYTYGEFEEAQGAMFVPVRLVAGRSAVIFSGTVRESRFTPEHGKRMLAWTVGMLHFEGESLAAAAAEFNRYNWQQIVIEDNSIARMHVGGRYRATDPEGFAHDLEHVFKIRAVSIRSGGRGASVIVLRKRGGTVRPKGNGGSSEGAGRAPDASGAMTV